MIKKIFKVILVFLMILGVAFTISNFVSKKANAVMTEELLDWYELPGGYAYRCLPDGQGCYTVELPQ